ncbi:MAG: hypothetical protein Q8R90_01540 [Bacteroidales bacterium]|nr:hypothetical protein [Bacteroidales bacterium]
MKKLFILIWALFLTSSSGYIAIGQTYEEYRKKEMESFRKFVQEEEAIISKMAAEINVYIKRQDREYREYLAKEWKSYSAFVANSAPKRPKPVDMPKFETVGKTVSVKGAAIAPSKEALSLYFKGAPSLTMPVSLPPDRSNDRANLRVNFYGVPLYLSYDPAFAVSVYGVNSERGIASYWERASASRYSSLVEQLASKRVEMNLNDFSYYLMVRRVAEGLYPGDSTGELLATWFLMVRSGFGARVGINGSGELLLMLPSFNTVYGLNFLKEGDRFLYIVSGGEGRSIRTYDSDYTNADKSIDFNIYSPMNLGGKVSGKNLEFDYNNKKYNILVNYDQGLVDLYRDYPQLEMGVYFNAAVSMQAKESIAASLLPVISEMSEREAVEFLLSFAQNSFKYKTDIDQFGYEKFFFAEEILFYPYSDCEDRAVFFSYIVRDLLGLDVVGVEFPEHMAAAVNLSQIVPGDYLTYNNRRYVITDPTYLGAPVGSAMPQFRESSPVVIPIENRRGMGEREEKVWSLARDNGCYPGSNLRNHLSLSDGSSVLTGYYTGSASFGGRALPPAGSLNRGFIGRINYGNALWVLPMQSDGNSVGISVAGGLNDDIYVAGSFRGNLTLGSSSINAAPGSQDAFIACINKGGVVRWITKLNLDTIPGSAPVAFSAVLSANGVKMGITKTIAPVEFNGYGLFSGNDGKIVYNGIVNRVFSSTPEVSTVSYASVAASPELLKKETDALVSDNTDKGIAGLFAAILLVKNMGATLSGSDARATLDMYNPGFKKSCPNLYKNLGMINFVKNNNGIITIQTQNGKDIYFDQIRVKNNANINIVPKSSGDLTVDILSGVLVGKMVVWFKLNSILLSKKTGDMTFDYDKDNSTAKINMTKDILM